MAIKLLFLSSEKTDDEDHLECIRNEEDDIVLKISSKGVVYDFPLDIPTAIKVNKRLRTLINQVKYDNKDK